ncbi:hypothetical protein Prum_052860 [Phytohabitans rumicis]|uniref:FMN hydroxy acid dehydrogenase domain-containing protein n=1 Tax=Phytohabitans rumicis TaxID=1076125 RepID=A0A6V8L5Y0_9ACTN|nr:hypothetical protein Prum_052860 [Phytohabitans rumicis]
MNVAVDQPAVRYPEPGLADLLCLDDVEAAARRVLPAGIRDYVAGGSGAELTLRANRSAFDSVCLVPRILAGAGGCDLATRLLGTDLAMPVGVAPMAYQRLAHPDGELGLARAAREAGAVYVASMLSSYPIEEIAATGAAVWFQLYWLHDRRLVCDLLERAEEAGCRAIVLTVDVPRMGRRLRDMRSGFALPDGIVAANLPAAAGAAAGQRQARGSALMVHTRDAFDPPCPGWRSTGCAGAPGCPSYSRGSCTRTTRCGPCSSGWTRWSSPTTAGGSSTALCPASPRSRRYAPRSATGASSCWTAAYAAAWTCCARWRWARAACCWAVRRCGASPPVARTAPAGFWICCGPNWKTP